jgi:hypothetical protein
MSREANIGTRVRELKRDIKIEKETERARSLNTAPASPSRKTIGGKQLLC